ncbi:putative membrane-associated kinase regulator 2 [Heracleum sosnowskyi]|uniref:Membrane-associated kinase regulator 2 n=1 Tax=Heracleum sosnowskyi TaxID=360622 RepID=A0AAD8HFM0_9APIA|nr:putative membrane-associated kinase regulator 2 [Heracleum sosnowskyi]
MEVFSLLKFWRNTAGDLDIRNRAPDSDDETEDFFDLVFTGADCEFKQQQNQNSPASSTTTKVHIDNDNPKSNQTVLNKPKSPKLQAGETKSSSIRKILPIETHSKPLSPNSLLKSPYKFRVFMFGLRDKAESSPSRIATTEEVEIPMNAYLNRDNSLRSKMRCEILEDSSPVYELGKKNTGVHKYIKLIRPFYVKASKIKIFDQSPTATPSSTASVSSPRKFVDDKNGGRAVVFRGAYKSFLRNRWTSSSVGAGPSPSPVSRRDDSVMQQQDGIQGAILHCKRSFSLSPCSSTRSQECAVLSRSASDSSHQKAINSARISVEEKRSSI